MRAWGEQDHPEDRPRGRREPRDRPPAAARNRVEGDGGEPPRRGRIDLSHGFLRQIQRNQRDRKAYHEAWEDARDSTVDANKKEFGIGINVIKDGKEWKKPQQWRSFEREGGAAGGKERDDDRRSNRRDEGERRPKGSDDRRDHSADDESDDDLRSRLTRDEAHERTAAALRSAEAKRSETKKSVAAGADDEADLAAWWGETGGDKAASDIRAATQKETRQKKQPATKPGAREDAHAKKPSAKAEPFKPKSSPSPAKNLDGSAPAFVPKTKEIKEIKEEMKETKKINEETKEDGALDDWSALDEELEKALNEKKSRGRRR